MSTNAQVMSVTKTATDGKPVITNLMSKKLAYACRMNPNTWGMALGYCTGAETVGDLKKLLTLMEGGAPELCEKFLVDLFNNNGTRTPGYLINTAGFTEEEVQIAIRLIIYFEEEEEKKENAQRQKVLTLQDSLFAVWSKNGVPENISPNVHAIIKCGDTISFVAYLDSLNIDLMNNHSLKLNVEIDKYGDVIGVEFLDSGNMNHKDQTELLTRMKMNATPAKYVFNRTLKSIDMASIETVDIFENLETIKGNGFYEDPEKIHLMVKYNRKKQQCEIINYYGENNDFKKICEREGINEFFVLNKIVSYLEQTSYDGKLRIEFYICRRKLFVRQRSVGVITSGNMTPKTIIESVRKVNLFE